MEHPGQVDQPSQLQLTMLGKSTLSNAILAEHNIPLEKLPEHVFSTDQFFTDENGDYHYNTKSCVFPLKTLSPVLV